MLQAARHPNVQHLMAEESMKPLKCPSPVTVAAAHIAAKHGVVVKMRGTMGSPAGQAPGDSEASGGENDATFFVFEDDKENVDPKTGVSARLSSGAGSRSGARLDDPFPRGRFFGRDFGIFWLFAKRLALARRTDPYRALPCTADEFEVAFGVLRDPARVAEAAVGAPSRQPLADVTARYVPPTVREPCPEEYQQPAVCRPRLFSFSKRKVRMLGARGKTRGSRRKTRRIADQNQHSTSTGTSLSGKGRDHG